MEKGDKKKDYGNEALGMRVRELRQKKGLTHQELADLIGTSRGFITKLENGERDLKSWAAVELADALGTTCDYLLRGIEPENIDVSKELGLKNAAIKKLRAAASDRAWFKNDEFIQGINLLASNEKGISIARQIYRYIQFDIKCKGTIIDRPDVPDEQKVPPLEVGSGKLKNGESFWASIDDDEPEDRYSPFENIQCLMYELNSKDELQQILITPSDIVNSIATEITNSLKNWRDEIQNAKKDE